MERTVDNAPELAYREMQSSDAPKGRRKSTRRPEDDIPSTSGPPVKNSRLGVKEGTEKPEECSVKTRRSIKIGRLAPPKCCFCKEEQHPEDEDLKQCSECSAHYHIKKCLRYKAEFARNIAKNDDWKCPRCTTCVACEKLVNDPGNLECSVCCRTWHGLCAPKRYEPPKEFDADWVCSNCSAHGTARKPRPPARPRYSLVLVEKEEKMEEKGKVWFDGPLQPLTDILSQRDYIWDKLSHEAGLLSKCADPVFIPQRSVLRKTQEPILSFNSDPVDTLVVSDAPEAAEEEDDNAKLKNFMLQFDRRIYYQSKRQAYGSSKPIEQVRTDAQWLHFGTGKACKALYKSAFKEPLSSAAHLYACKFCLHTMDNYPDFRVHWELCDARYPPGNEIYRHDDLSFFEVDGAKQKRYCRNLCLLAKLFIASKTLYDEVDTFIFYVLCEVTKEGFVIVGYFSKERNPAENNNLSCLLVLPTEQKKGYGRLLIDMSYELSRIEHRIGHPEHPLSDLGILAYRGYWRSSLMCYLRSLKNTDRVSLKEMCLETRIEQVDIVNQLMLDNLIVLKNGEYFIKIAKRALKYPLSQCRRRTVDRTKIIWAPEPTGEVLDPRKINTYV